LVEDYERKRIEANAPDPIEAIKFRMDQMNLTQRDLVPFIGSRSRVSEVLSRKRALTFAMARALHKGLGIPAKALMREQLLFDTPADDVEWDRFPIRTMIERGWIKESIAYASSHAKELMLGFLAPLGKSWSPEALYKQTRYVRSAREMDQYALAAWNARVCIRAQQAPPPVVFDRSVLTEEFMRELAHLSTLKDGPLHAKEYLTSAGISVIVEPHLPETYIDGAALSLSPTWPVVALTLRHDRIDNFWFVLMHELVHVSLHLGGETGAFYDDLDSDDVENEKEREADSVAGEVLIPEDEWERSPASKLRTPEAVEHLAKRLRIHPAIVAGKIRHYYKSYRVLNRLVGQGEVRCLFPEMGSSRG
jgi:HTH-type transcriptional regulator/antitoxin HigA